MSDVDSDSNGSDPQGSYPNPQSANKMSSERSAISSISPGFPQKSQLPPGHLPSKQNPFSGVVDSKTNIPEQFSRGVRPSSPSEQGQNLMGKFSTMKSNNKRVQENPLMAASLDESNFRNLEQSQKLRQIVVNRGQIPLPSKNRNMFMKVNHTQQIETIFYLIQEIISKLDVNKYLEFNKSIGEAIYNLSQVSSRHSDTIKEHITKAATCSMCRSLESNIELSCRHALCGKCSQKQIKLAENVDGENPYDYFCPICDEKLSNQEIKCIFPGTVHPIKINLEKTWILNRFAMGNLVTCHSCKKVKGKDGFFESTCMHMCRDCVARSIRDNKYECSACEKEFDNIEKLSGMEMQCMGCSDQAYFVGDYMKVICHGHLLCNVCLYLSLNKTLCVACNRRLSKFEEIEINDHLFRVCRSCGRDADRKIFNDPGKAVCNECESNQ